MNKVFFGPVPKHDAESAQNKIIAVINKLQRSGEIIVYEN